MKIKNLTLDPKKPHPALLATVVAISADKRITKIKLKEFLAKRYKESLANRLSNILSVYFNKF